MGDCKVLHLDMLLWPYLKKIAKCNLFVWSESDKEKNFITSTIGFNAGPQSSANANTFVSQQGPMS